MAGLSQGSPKGHVGYYLVSRGETELRAAFRYQASAREWLLDEVLAHPNLTYFGSVALILGTAVLVLMGWLMASVQSASWRWLGIAAVTAILPLSELVLGLLNHAFTLLFPPRVLLKLEFKEGIPEEFATVVVMPSMLVRPRSAELLCERLESHYLANPTARVCFALLTDFGDAPQEVMPEDQSLIRDALERVRARTSGMPPRARTYSSCFIAAGCGTRHRAAGWDGNESVESSRSSTG